MPKQRTEQVWKNFKKVCGLWKENESGKNALKIALKNYFSQSDKRRQFSSDELPILFYYSLFE